MATLDTTATLAALGRTNDIAKARKLALNAIEREIRSGAGEQALRESIARILRECDIREANICK